ncbi:uncharacterized protein TNCV_1511211 [Trichonephila clavipes]|nr:uncharacterized protein TNCV_1511211 [Trichonephila clavipes]
MVGNIRYCIVLLIDDVSVASKIGYSHQLLRSEKCKLAAQIINAIKIGFWQPVLCEVNDAENDLQTEELNIHQFAKKIRALQTVLEAKQEEFVDDAKSLYEEHEISFEPP